MSNTQYVIRNTNTNIFGHQKLIVWKVADELAKEIYKITVKFPKDELYGITSQLRRAALSIVLNIIEGYSRNNKNEFRQFLRISLGSLAETGYLLEFSFGQNYLLKEDFEKLISLKNRCGSLLWKLFESQSL